MTESDTDRIERGRALAKKLYPESSKQLLDPLKTVAPDFERLVLGGVVADIWDREQLSLRERVIIRLAVIAALGEPESATQTAIGTALNVGVSTEDIAEVFVQTSPQVGIIRVIAALEALTRHAD
jgi:alkylhydroperoxidase/carboxymuconolactone decarboxylase family protein YurZ